MMFISPVRGSRARACREERNALSEQLTTVTIRMRQAEIENIDLNKSKESFDQIIERKNREMMMKEEEFKTYTAQHEQAMRQVEIEIVDLKKSKESLDQIIERKNREIMVKEEELKTYIAQQEHAARREKEQDEAFSKLKSRILQLEGENEQSKKMPARNDVATVNAHVPGQTATTDPSLLARLRHLESENKDLQEALVAQKEASRNDAAEASGASSHAEENSQRQQPLNRLIGELEQTVSELRQENMLLKNGRSGADLSNKKLSQELLRKEEELRGWEHSWIKTMDASARVLMRRRVLKIKCFIFERWTKHVEVSVRNQRLGERKIWQMYRMLRRVVKNALIRMQIWALDSKQRRTRYHRIVGKCRFRRLDATFKHLSFKLSTTRLRRQATNTLMRKWRSAAHESTDLMNRHLEDEEVMGWKLQGELERWIDKIDEAWLSDATFLNERWQEHVRLLQVQERLRASGLRGIHKMMKRDLVMAFYSFCQVPHCFFYCLSARSSVRFLSWNEIVLWGLSCCMRVVVSCLGSLSHPLVVSCQGIGELKRARDAIKRLLAVMQHRALQRAWELLLTATSQSVYQRQWQETSATQHSAVTVSL
jgi:hypothetical protein